MARSSRFELFYLFATIFFRLSSNLVSGQCMPAPGSTMSFDVEGVCYWVYPASTFKTWQSAMNLCQLDGTMAYINSSTANSGIAAMLSVPVFIGYQKSLDGTWDWVNSNSSYVNSFVDNSGVHMTMQDGTGYWEPSNVDIWGHEYGLLCALDMDPYLRCPIHSVANSDESVSQPLYSGESITFTCLSGFHISVGQKVQTISCVPGRRFSYPTRDCTPIVCDLFDPPAYTERNSDDFHVGAIVNYTCNEPDTWFGFNQKEQAFECMPDGYWSPPLGPCFYIRCDPPPLLDMGVFNSSSTLSGAFIEYTCLNGWVFADGNDTKVISCEGNPPGWQNNDTMTSLACIPIYCAAEKPTRAPSFDGILSSESFLPYNNQVGHIQMWYCFVGFAHRLGPVGTAVECLKSIQEGQPHDWLKAIPSCEPNGCAPLVVQNATASATSELFPSAYPLTLTCEDGWYFPGGETQMTVTCMDTSYWDWEPPISGCDVTDCEEGWVKWEGSCYYISRANSLGLRYYSAEQFCNYRFSNLAIIFTEREAHWIGRQTYDISGRDYWIGFHKNGTDWEWYGSLWNNFTYWPDGYPERFDCTRSSVDGWWKDRDCDELLPFICKKTSICGDGPVIANGEPVGLPAFPVNVGTKMKYRCDPGYRFQNGSFEQTIECVEGGWWSKIGNCVIDKCPALNNGNLKAHGTYLLETPNFAGDVVIFTCQVGLLFPSGSNKYAIECMPGGAWNDTDIPECEEFECSKPAAQATTAEFEYKTWGAMDYFKCKPGYSFQDQEISKLFRCTQDATWLPNDQVCVPRKCPKYSLPFAHVEPDEGVFTDQIVVTCREGYIFPDTSYRKVLTCEADGQWSKVLKPCVRTSCEGPTPPNITNTFKSTDEVYSGTFVNYSCLYGTVFIDGDFWKVAHCDSDTLQWYGIPTPCVDEAVFIQTEFVHPATESEQGPQFGTLGLGLTLSVLCLVVLFDLITGQRQLDTCRANFASTKEDTVTDLTDLKQARSRNTSARLVRESTISLQQETRETRSARQNRERRARIKTAKLTMSIEKAQLADTSTLAPVDSNQEMDFMA